MKQNQIDFFIVGAARCGTTFLYNCLNSNSSIFLPKVKEPNFFSNVETLISEEYDNPRLDKVYHSKIIKSNKIYNSLYIDANPDQIKGDVSPSYLWDLNTAKRLFEHNPNAKIIITLRNPVDRAYSHYKMNYFIGKEHLNFKEALKAKKNSEWGGSNKYLEIGLYHKQVKKYFEVFPRNQIMIIIYEDWIKNLNLCMGDIAKFLEVQSENFNFESKEFETNEINSLKHIKTLNYLRNSSFKKSIKKALPQNLIDKLKNTFFKSNNKLPELESQTRESLKGYFEEDIVRLDDILNKNLLNKWFN